jgi:hypothetical protein
MEIMSKENILNEVIIGYRNVIYQRYQYHSLQEKFRLPDSINEEIITQLRDYYLNYIYPQFDKREELNHAFNSLDFFIKHPDKLLRLLIESLKLLVKHGKHLPQILNTGLNAFKVATRFEDKLVEKALINKLEPPYDLSKIYTLIKLLPRKEIEKFIDGSKTLFETIHNRELVQKIKEILSHLVSKMKLNQQLYSFAEIRGLEIGLEIIMEGDKFFNQLTQEGQDLLVPLIIKIESDALDEIFLER